MVFSKEEAQKYDRMSELKAFDETKAGVKGLVDAGITKVPQIFIQPQETLLHNSSTEQTNFIFPVIDLKDIDNKDSNKRKEIVDKVRDASKTWGFFQVINHGIPLSVLEEMLQGARQFFEQDVEVKKEFYSRDITKKVVYYNSEFDFYTSPAANWKDTLLCLMAPNPPSVEEIPTACREILMEYSKHVMKVGCTLLELLSEGLGLKPSHLKDMDCAEGLVALCHYYPTCPQPELTLGTAKHSDNDFITLLLQDHQGGLQVFHNNHWIDVPPTPGSLVVNIGDLLQLISNGNYISVEHRVLANKLFPRVSVASFFSTGHIPSPKLYGPIKELLSGDNPAKYRETTVSDYLAHCVATKSGGKSALPDFMI